MAQESEAPTNSIESVGQGQVLTDWSLRPWLLAGLGALAGLIFYLFIEYGEDQPWPMAGAAFTFAAALSLAFTVRPRNWREPATFSLLAGLVMGGLAFQTVYLEDRMAGEEYAFAAGIFAVVLALPLFQAGFHRTRFATDYATTHFHVWTDAVSAGGAIAFTGLSWILLLLLDQLLGLVGIELIESLIDEEWFGFAWSGGAFGAALGVLRNNLKVIGALQAVVLIVLSLLAVPLALALIVFLAALILSGGQALWEATDSATPVLLACAAGCFVLANVIVRQDHAARSRNAVMQAAALVLAVGILPLAVFAAISMGIRIDQYGLAPERLWALVAIIVATVYGVAYWVGLALGRRAGWAARLRQANLHLAVATCALALFLALPILDFGGISARNQVARLQGGKVTPEEFDFAALRWDFGAAGRRALERLAEGEGQVGELARAALSQTERPYRWAGEVRADGDFNLRVQPDDPRLRERVLAKLRAEPWRCREYCVAVALEDEAGDAQRVALVEDAGFEVLELSPGADVARQVQPPVLTEDSEVEVHTVPRRYIFIDGRPFNQPIDPATPPPVRLAPPE